jgi:hypothetical protein
MKNSNDTIGNRTRDLPACSAVPQPTAPPRASQSGGIRPNMSKTLFQSARGLSSVSIQRCKIRGASRLIGSRQAPLDQARNWDALQMLHEWQLLNCNIL